MEELNVSLVLEEIPVKVTDKEGKVLNYILREFTGEPRDKFLTWVNAHMKFDDSGKVQRMDNYEGMQAALLSQCLFDDNSKLITADVLQKKYPAKTLNTLFKAAQKLNGLDGEGLIEIKND